MQQSQCGRSAERNARHTTKTAARSHMLRRLLGRASLWPAAGAMRTNSTVADAADELELVHATATFRHGARCPVCTLCHTLSSPSLASSVTDWALNRITKVKAKSVKSSQRSQPLTNGRYRLCSTR